MHLAQCPFSVNQLTELMKQPS